jgi:D-sedoheptulose 7-phosphate isomerase
MTYIEEYMQEVKSIVDKIDHSAIASTIDKLLEIRGDHGRLFFLGVGGGAAAATHAVNDFRKIAGIESYSPCDNVSELTARINDDGWESSFVGWLKGSRLGDKDGVFVFSVGGGNRKKKVSVNLVHALEYSKQVGAKVLGVVGRDGGYTGEIADSCIIIPTVNPNTVTPHTEAFQAVILHLIVSHPKIRLVEAKWESLTPKGV